MILNVLTIFGGVGLFLVGMTMMTDGLRRLAGIALRNVLARYTKSPASGAVTGAVTTAILQSSSATTVTVVGFVGAGLLTFPQALGVIFGANIGTTITGWLVALIGFKLKIGLLALPLVFVGALMRFLARGKACHAGWALAGFGLLFVGIDTMQQAMSAYEGMATPSDFPPDTVLGRLELVLLGVVITMITQSSSAGVATALVALSAGAISLPQAAAMVIGMNVGTTFTAALATVGGSAAMRQTAFAHIVYNVVTGVIAYFLLPVYASLASTLQGGEIGDGQITLVAFHTLFNCLGLLLALPLARPFARLVQRLVPDHHPPLVTHLDRRLLSEPQAAVDAASATARDISRAVLELLERTLDPKRMATPDQESLRIIDDAVQTTRGYIEQIRTGDDIQAPHRRHIDCMHALDHLGRMTNRLTQTERIRTLRKDSRLRRLAGLLCGYTRILETSDSDEELETRLANLDDLFVRQNRLFRERLFNSAAHRKVEADEAILRLDAMRWLSRMAHHLHRLTVHLDRALAAPPVENAAPEPSPEP
ncbi:Na/Pi cotransporter family protein [Stappia sp. GBMRC 2046]|uniref:Na/Pi cotransporter family protein n=1 Tax=Stappia sediminis TaxID=2692190 RepID=A0A7X3S8D5_9HYPH|nr:Na/Pi symporter [Stappia sediminis]MXN65640.1 Na/Pi cotransporter family protein [Stappia sediminis]